MQACFHGCIGDQVHPRTHSYPMCIGFQVRLEMRLKLRTLVSSGVTAQFPDTRILMLCKRPCKSRPHYQNCSLRDPMTKFKIQSQSASDKSENEGNSGDEDIVKTYKTRRNRRENPGTESEPEEANSKVGYYIGGNFDPDNIPTSLCGRRFDSLSEFSLR